jgi:hypothetical protein
VRGERGLGAVDARSTRPAASLGQSVAARPCGPAAGALRARSASPARPRRSPRLPPLPIAIDGGGLGPDHGQEGVGEHGQGGPAVSGPPAADLMGVQADQALAGLEALLDPPALPGDTDQPGQRHRPGRIAAVEGQLAGALVARTSSQCCPAWPPGEASPSSRRRNAQSYQRWPLTPRPAETHCQARAGTLLSRASAR